MRRLHGVTIVYVSLMVAPSAWAQPQPEPRSETQPENTERAAEFHRRGVVLFEDEDWEAAVVAFSRAYELAPHPDVLFNIGIAQIEQHDYVGARETLRQFLEDSGPDRRDERATQAREELELLAGRIGTLVVHSNHEDVEIRVDTKSIGRTPVEPYDVNAGRHLVIAYVQGRSIRSERIEVGGGDEVVVEITLEEADITPETTRTPVVQDIASGPEVPWWAWITTGVLGIAAGTMAILALTSSSSLDDELATIPGNPEAIDSARSDTESFSIAADVLTGAAVAMGTLALVWTVVELSGDGEDSESSTASVHLGPGHVRLTGVF